MERVISEEDLDDIWTWNARVPPQIDICVHDLIAEVCKRQPEASAVCAWDGEWTYGELDSISTTLAEDLQRRGVAPNSVVALFLEKSKWTPIIVLGVMKAGGASTIFDCSQPVESQTHGRIRGIIQRLKPVLMIATQTTLEILTSVAENTTSSCLDGHHPKATTADLVTTTDSMSREDTASVQQTVTLYLSQSAAEDLPQRRGVEPCDMLYVVFTSGSTGLPKGVIINHTNFSTAIRYQQEAHGIDADSRIYDFSSYAFDAAWSNLLHAFTSGACLCIPSEIEKKDDLAGSIHRLKANIVDLTPSTARLLSLSVIQSLKTLIVAGEVLRIDDVQRWAGLTSLRNVYGPCECTPTATIATLTTEATTPSIGQGLGVNTWVVDPTNAENLVPIGCNGELLLEGPIIGPGYFEGLDKNMEAFIFDPTWLVRGGPRQEQTGRKGRLYKTGDLVYQANDGSLTFVGRKDTQVKINGQRLELGEVEHHVREALRTQYDAKEVVVEAIVPYKSSKLMLVAFIDFGTVNGFPTTRDETRACAQKLKLQVRDNLIGVVQAHAVPTFFVPISGFPMTTSGKVDRVSLHKSCQTLTLEQLIALYSSHQGLLDQQIPITPMEQLLQKLWSTVLEAEEQSIQTHDNFFDMGGDSVGAMMLAGLIRKEGCSLTVASVFKNPILSFMAKEVITRDVTEHINQDRYLKPPAGKRHAALSERAAKIIPIDIELIEDVYPCTVLQESLLSFTMRRSDAFIFRNTWELRSTIDPDRFLEAWRKVFDTVPILRTLIVDISQETLMQVVVKNHPSWTHAEDLALYLDHDRETTMGLGKPLIRIALIMEEQETENPRRLFVLTMHHVLYDGWSISLLLQHLENAYQGLDLQSPPPFRRFVEHVKDLNQPKDVAPFWTNQMLNLQAPIFPLFNYACHQPRPDRSIRFHIYNLSWPKINITASNFVKVAWSVVVGQYTDSEDVLFGITKTGRQVDLEGIEHMIGPTIATIPIRIQLDSNETVKQLLSRVQNDGLYYAEHEQYGLRNIRKLNSDTERACQFQTLLDIHALSRQSKQLESILFMPESDREGNEQQQTTSLDAFDTVAMTLVCHIFDSSLEIEVVFDSTVIETTRVERLMSSFDQVLKKLCEIDVSQSRLHNLMEVSEVDLDDIWKWNATVPLESQHCVHHLVSITARQQSRDTLAVCAWDGDWTYDELDRLSSKFALQLVSEESNIGANKVVALMIEKSRWSPVSTLAVMKAGAASVMLDPTLPQERLLSILTQAKAVLILASPLHHPLAIELTEQLPQQIPIRQIDAASIEDSRVDKQSISVLPKSRSSDMLYVCFTSGSTGVPKGVVITHANFSSAILHQQQCLGFFNVSKAKQVRVFDFAAYTFDVAWSNLLHTLTSGACLCIPSEADRINDIAGVMARFQVTHADLTPSVARLLPIETIKSLTTLVLGGEALLQEDFQRWAGLVNLINPYGPCECSPTSTILCIRQNESFCGGIGQGLGVNTWVTNMDGSLAPIGCVGELLLEGPLLGLGYLDEPEKTKTVFIEDPSWLLKGTSNHSGRQGRLYRTGDLVRYNEDGSLIFVGRKDNQIKLHGQRIELGEIQDRVLRHPCIRQSAGFLPSVGPCAGRIVCVFSLNADDYKIAPSSDIVELLDDAESKRTSLYVEEIKNDLQMSVPTYMIPSLWFAVKQIPLTTSGKADLRKLESHFQDLNSEQGIRAQYSDTDSDLTLLSSTNVTEIEMELQDACSHVLNMPTTKIDLTRSFVTNGGDSISAMRLVSRCREKNILLSVSNILKSKSLLEVATQATFIETQDLTPSNEYHYDIPSKLSPIQQWFFLLCPPELVNTKPYLYVQTLSLEVKEPVSKEQMSSALSRLIQEHSMLRARFAKVGEEWSQSVEQPNQIGQLDFESFELTSESDLKALMIHRRDKLDLEQGPVFVASLFHLPDGDQFLIMVAHHLVVDLVSWRILSADLEMLLKGEPLPPNIPFTEWNKAQEKMAISSELDPGLVLPQWQEIKHNLDYWRLSDAATNTVGDHKILSTKIDEHITTLMLGEANIAATTEPLDLLLTAVWNAFFNVFPDRDELVITLEGHGRQPWTESIDLTRTVGWFTTMCPLQMLKAGITTTDELLKRVKDARRRIPANGWAYFASRFFNDKGKEAFKPHGTLVEVEFNFHGQFQEMEHEDSLFHPYLDDFLVESGPAMPAGALLTINIYIESGTTFCSFSWNRHIAHQDKIQIWFEQIGPSLQDLCHQLAYGKSSIATLSDYASLTDLDYAGLEELNQRMVPAIEIATKSTVEEVLPCSSLVEGILLAQTKQPQLYRTSELYEISLSNDGNISLHLLQEAWKHVVASQPSLRCVFIQAVSGIATFNQIILNKDFVPEIIAIENESSTKGLHEVTDWPLLCYNEQMPAHRVLLCNVEAENKVLCRIEMSHTITDGASTALLLKDWASAYQGDRDRIDLLETSRCYARSVSSLRGTEQISFWSKKLSNVEPCIFPRLSRVDGVYSGSRSAELKFSSAELESIRDICKEYSVTLASLFQSAWALTLAAYSGTDSVCFGYLTSGRDLPVVGLDRSIGAYARLLVCRVNSITHMTKKQAVQCVYQEMIEDLDHQHCSLAQMLHSARCQRLFNSTFNFQTASADVDSEASSSLNFRSIESKDPTEVSNSI